MKNILFISLVFLVQLFVETPIEAPIPICQTTAHDMAAWAADPEFQKLHPSPLPYHYAGKGEMISFPAPDGKNAQGFLLKTKKKSNKWLFVYQEWWGLNDQIKQEAEKYFNDLKDVNVLALDMYDGQVTNIPQEAGKIMQSVPKERLTNIVKAAYNYAGDKAKIASVGWCFGGMMSLQSALIGGKQVVGCVMYYGRPEQDVEKLKTLQTDVLGIFGSQDKGPSPEMVAQFEQNMKTAGKKVTIKMYDAAHGFANPSNPRHDPAATADAYKHALSYLKERF